MHHLCTYGFVTEAIEQFCVGRKGKTLRLANSEQSLSKDIYHYLHILIII